MKNPVNPKGYIEGKPEHSDLISRQIAYLEIYKRNREKYPLQFRYYVVHHIDGEKKNNSIKNLCLLTKEEHNFIHSVQNEKQISFLNSREIEEFLKERRLPEEQKKLFGSTSNFNNSFNENERIIEEQLRIKQEKINNEKNKEGRKYIFISMFILIIFFLFLFGAVKIINLSNQTTNTLSTPQMITTPIPNTTIEPVPIPAPSQEVLSLIVEGSNTDVILTNNRDKDISVNVTYRIFSKWFGMDSIKNKLFQVNANSKESFRVYDACAGGIGDCSIIILDFQEEDD